MRPLIAALLVACGPPRLAAIDDGRVAVPDIVYTSCRAAPVQVPEHCFWPIPATSRAMETTFAVALEVAPDGHVTAVRPVEGVAEGYENGASACAAATRFGSGDGEVCDVRYRLRRYASDVGERHKAAPGGGCSGWSGPAPGDCQQNNMAPWP